MSFSTVHVGFSLLYMPPKQFLCCFFSVGIAVCGTRDASMSRLNISDFRLKSNEFDHVTEVEM